MEENNVQATEQVAQQDVQQQTKVASARQGYNPEYNYDTYNDVEWAMKEEWYIHTISAITVPAVAPTHDDLQRAAVALNRVLDIAYVDAARISAKNELYSNYLKIMESECALAIQNDQNITVGTKSSAKLTISDIENLVRSTIANKEWKQTGKSLYEIKAIYNNRNCFMNNVLKMVAGKKDLFITTAAVLKIDVSLSGAQT